MKPQKRLFTVFKTKWMTWITSFMTVTKISNKDVSFIVWQTLMDRRCCGESNLSIVPTPNPPSLPQLGSLSQKWLVNGTITLAFYGFPLFVRKLTRKNYVLWMCAVNCVLANMRTSVTTEFSTTTEKSEQGNTQFTHSTFLSARKRIHS